MRLSAQIRYDATPEQVFRMLTDRGFQERKCAETGALNYDVEITTDGDLVTVVSRRQLPTDTIPDFVRSFVGSTLTVRQVEQWSPAGVDGTRVGSLTVEIASAPVRFTGGLRMGAAGPDGSADPVAPKRSRSPRESGAVPPGPAGTVETIDGDLKASVPLIGGRIEKASEPAIRAAIQVEQRTGTAWLAERPG